MMRMPLLAFLGLVTLALAGCTPPGQSARVASGTGHSEGGIGGTGLRPDEQGDTGLFGTITGFGSIHLNGLMVELPAGIRAEGLAVSDTVAVEAVRDGAKLVARKVTAMLPIAGPIERLDLAHRLVSVMGTPVLLDDGAILSDRAGSSLSPSALAVGDWLQVSGLWRSGTVVASRLVRVPATVSAHVAGLLGGEGSLRHIGGTALDLSCCAAIESGFTLIRGTYTGGRLVALRVEAGTAAMFSPSVGRLIVEAFLARNPNAPGFHLSGFGIPMDPASPVPPTVGQRSIFVGRLHGDFLIEHSYALPSDAAARQRELDLVGPRLLE